MHKKFEINRTKIKVGCQSGRKVVTHDSKSDLPLVTSGCLSFQRYQKFQSIIKDRFGVELTDPSITPCLWMNMINRDPIRATYLRLSDTQQWLREA